MATSIGNLAVKITASGAQATAEMDRVRKSIQEIDREAKRSGGANWIQTRMGITDGGGRAGMDEMRKFKAEQLAAARAGREVFDAQIGGGAAVAAMSKFKGVVTGATGGFMDLAAKAWVAKEAIHNAFTTGSAIVKAFKGDIQGAQKELAGMGMTGWLNDYGRMAGEWFSDKFVEKDVHKNARAAEAAAGDLEKQRAERQRDAERKRREDAFKNDTRKMLYEAQLAGADPFTADQIRTRMYAEDQMAALKSSGMDQTSPAYLEREAAIRRSISGMEEKALLDEEKRQAEAAADAKHKQEIAAKEQADLAKRAQEEQIRRADEMRSIQSDIQAKQFTLLGRSKDAELVMIREKYRQRIEEARRAGDLEMVEQLKTAQRLDEAGAKRTPEGSAVQIRRAYTYTGPRGRSENEVRIGKGDPEQTGYLKRMADRLDQGVSARAA